MRFRTDGRAGIRSWSVAATPVYSAGYGTRVAVIGLGEEACVLIKFLAAIGWAEA